MAPWFPRCLLLLFLLSQLFFSDHHRLTYSNWLLRHQEIFHN